MYYISKEMYATQVIVIKELLPEDSIYLHCLTQNLSNPILINNLTEDYSSNKTNELYTNYMHQFLGAHMKGENLMVCENLFRLYGTSSEEIAEKTREQDKQIYLPQIEKLTDSVNTLTSENQNLKQLLAQHNIAY